MFETNDMAAQWGAALSAGSGAEYSNGKTAETVPTNAIGSMTPVDTSVTTPSWEKFMQDTLGGLVGYAVRKDAIKSGISGVPATQSGGAITPTTGNEAADAAKRERWNTILVVGGVVVAAGVGFAIYRLSK